MLLQKALLLNQVVLVHIGLDLELQPLEQAINWMKWIFCHGAFTLKSIQRGVFDKHLGSLDTYRYSSSSLPVGTPCPG